MRHIIPLVLLLLWPAASIIAVGPIEASPNTENSPSVYYFPFKLDKDLPTTGYLLVTMPNYGSSVTPTTCKLANTNIVLSCCNLRTPTISTLTISQASILAVNPNINALLTVAIKSNMLLTKNTNYYLQIVLTNVVPSTGKKSDSFEFYSVSGNSIIYEQNWNFGQVEYQPTQTYTLAVNSLASLTSVLPSSTSTFLIDITINRTVQTTNSRIKIVLQDPFTFKSSSLVTTQNDPLYAATNGNSLYIAPTIVSTVILTPNVIITTFNEALIVGRKFILSITDVLSPFTRSSGTFSIYSLPFNSINPYESNELNLQIRTTFFPLTVNLGLPQGMPYGDPIQFYISTDQYMVVTLQASQEIPAGYAIYLSLPAVTILSGTAYANTSTTSASSIIYNYTTTTLLVSGFSSIVAGSTITISFKATVNSASVQAFATIDLYTNTFPVTDPMYYGVSSIISAVTGSSSFLTSIAGDGTSWNLIAVASGDSQIQFTINPSDSSTGSFLDIYMSAFVSTSSSFSSSTSCVLSGGVSATAYCSVVTNPTYLNIQINSSSSGNYFPIGSSVTVTISNLRYVAASSHNNFQYPMFFKFTRSQAVNPVTYSWMYTPNVIPQRDQLSGFYLTISNELANAGVNYPNVLRIHSTVTTGWTYTIQPSEIRVISLCASLGFRSSIQVPNLNSYYCASNINVRCTYTKGETSTTLTKKTPLDWDRIDIFLDGNSTHNETSTFFHVIIPHIFTSTSTHYFELFIGKYDKVTRQFSYNNLEPTKSFNPSSASYTSKTKVSTMMLQLSGKAGSYASNVVVEVAPQAGTYSLSSSSAIIVSSTWEIFTSLSALESNLMNNNSVVTFGTNNNAPLSLWMGSNYLTYIPFVTASTVAFSFTLDSIHLPYTYDLPYYSIFLTNSIENIDCYNQFINTNAGVFYYSVLLGLTISCVDNSLGVLNTVCYIGFINNHEIVKNGKIYVEFSGMTVSTDVCQLTYTTDTVSNTSIPVTCTSTSNQTNLIVSLPDTAASNYPNTVNPSYVLKVFGIGINQNNISQWVTLTLRDNSGSYIIETGTRLLTTTVANPLAVSINQITYKYSNPIVKSSMYISFTLPRSLYIDETFVIILGKDLSDSNTLIQKLNIQLYDSSGNVIETIQSLSSISYKLTFTVTNPSLIVQGNYTLHIYGLQIPSSNTNDIIYIIYQRNFDNRYTLTNDNTTTAPFPTLSNRINSLITLESLYNTEGLEQQLNFVITHTTYNVDSQTIWYINLPIYYSPKVWNDITLSYCQISGVMIPCTVDPEVPYQIKVYDSPRIINNGVQYTLSIYGIPCPRKRYLNNNATYANEYVFIGVAKNSTESQYIEYTEVYPNQAVINPSTASGYGLIRVVSVDSTSLNCFSGSYFKVHAISNIILPSGSIIYMTFPKEFDNFYDINLQVIVYVSNVAVSTGSFPVVKRRIAITLTSAIAASTRFIVEFSNLPTPKFPGTTDMNEMSIVVSSSDKSVTLAASSIKTNEAPKLTFISNTRYISFNSDSTVTITAGTYSSPISITSSDGQTFLSNILISYTSSGFTFKDNPTRIFLGDQSRQFTIGADMNLMPTYYVYNVIKTETSLLPYYTVLTNNNIRITNTQIPITVPSSITVPKGGCSLPIKVTLANAPYNDVSVNFVYNNSLYSSDVFWLNPETTNSQLNFTSTLTYQWISFCTSSSISVMSVPVSMVLGGTNYLSYLLSTSQLAVNIVTNVANTTPIISLNRVNVLKTVALYNFTTNTKGFIFYSLTLGSNVPPMNLLSLKVQVKSLALTLEAQSDFLTHIYLDDRDYRVGMLDAVNIGNNPITFSNLMPQHSYTLCAYFQNQFNVNSQSVCQTFTTQVWGVMSKAKVQFSKTLTSNELNNILCFFVKEVSAKITNIIDISGSSCSLGNSPQNYYYTYSGQSFSQQTTATSVYLISNPEVTTDASVTSFRNMFESGNKSITALSLSHALNDFFINYLSGSTFQYTFDPISAQDWQSSIKAEAFFDTPTFSSGTITIANVRVSTYGTVYFILQLQKQIFYNNITSETNITIKMDAVPTTEQVLNCKDWNNAAVVGCARAVLSELAQTVNVQFSGILADSFYKLYYVVANEYPLRPVTSGNVQSTTITTLIYGFRLLVGLVVVMLL